jgi:hypothetical protein
MSAQGRKLRKKWTKDEYEIMCSKLSAVVATANFQQKERSKKMVCRFLSKIESEKRLLSCSQ